MPPRTWRRRSCESLSNPELLARIATHVRLEWDVTEDELDEVVQETLLRALKAGSPPEDAAKMLAWLKSVAVNARKDIIKKDKRYRGHYPLRADVDVAAESPQPDLQKRAKWAADQVRKEGPTQAADVDLLMEKVRGKKSEEIGAERGMKAATVRQRTSRMAMRIREVAALASLGLALLIFGRTHEHITQAGRPWPLPDDPMLPLPPHRTASGEWRIAFKLCAAKDYEACLAALNQARRVDPEGEKDPMVVAARR